MAFGHEYRAQSIAPRERALAELARRQHGIVARWQLLEIAFTRSSIARLIGQSWLDPIHRGVYRVGHTRLSVRARWMAAVLACGRDALLSHHAAAALWELRRAPGGIDVTALTAHTHAGVRCHVTRTLRLIDQTTIDCIPVTTLERTLLDVAQDTTVERLRSMLESAQRRDLLDFRSLEGLISHSPGRHVRGLIAASRQLRDEAPWTQSELEQRLLELVRAAGLPEPQCNVYVAGVLVDFYWPAQRLVVEVDGYAFHRSRRSFESDRRNDTKLALARVRAIRVTARRIMSEPEALIADLQRLLIGSAAA